MAIIPKILFKTGDKSKHHSNVNLFSVSPIILHLLQVLAIFYARRNKPLVVTSLADGKHSKESYHYSGFAADTRVWGFTFEDIDEICDELREYLKKEVASYANTPAGLAMSKDWARHIDVINENDHIHLEYNARTEAAKHALAFFTPGPLPELNA